MREKNAKLEFYVNTEMKSIEATCDSFAPSVKNVNELSPDSEDAESVFGSFRECDDHCDWLARPPEHR